LKVRAALFLGQDIVNDVNFIVLPPTTSGAAFQAEKYAVFIIRERLYLCWLREELQPPYDLTFASFSMEMIDFKASLEKMMEVTLAKPLCFAV
jgi:hypothetical protein